MKPLLGVVSLDHELDQLNELTYFRCGASVPFAGRYRLIDFVLSNMMYAGITSVGLFIRRKYRSLLDHIGDGKPWDLDRRRGGLFILPPDWNDPTDISKGELQHFHNNLHFFRRSPGEYILYSGSRHIHMVDIQDAYEQHLNSRADVTLIYKKHDQLEPEHAKCVKLDVDSSGKVKDIHQEHNNPNVYMEMFIIEKSLFLDMVNICIAHGGDHFFHDVIQQGRGGLNVFAYEYKGYHAVINSVQSYYKNSMDLLKQEHHLRLFGKQPVQTKIKYEAPTQYLMNANVSNSLIANGCVIDGNVQNSIIFRGVRIESGASVVNSIVMQKSVIGHDSLIENVILDKDVIISSHRQLMGAPQQSFVVAKSSVI
jgi:glucose-1-phosphate adenylyltransferase